jgi:hypothetical protein
MVGTARTQSSLRRLRKLVCDARLCPPYELKRLSRVSLPLNPGYVATLRHCYDAAATTAATFSFVPDSGTPAAYLSPSFTLGTVRFTSVIGSPCVGAMVLTPKRSMR